MKQNKLLILGILALPIFLSACGGGSNGGGGGGSTTSSRNLPPDPGTAATATVAGVDTNNNGVRDEVEIALSKKITSDEQYSTTIRVAKAHQLMLTKPLPTTRAEALKAYGEIACASGTGVAYGQSSNAVSNLVFDTASRKDILSKIVKLTDGGFDGEELPACP